MLSHLQRLISKMVFSFLFFSFCSSTTFVLKADDNTVLDIDTLIDTLKTKYAERQPSDLVVECPSPFRNDRPIILPLIGGYNTLRGKWALKMDECDRAFFPDFWDTTSSVVKFLKSIVIRIVHFDLKKISGYIAIL